MTDERKTAPADDTPRIKLDPRKILALNGVEGAQDLAETIKVGATKEGRKS